MMPIANPTIKVVLLSSIRIYTNKEKVRVEWDDVKDHDDDMNKAIETTEYIVTRTTTTITPATK